MSAPISTPEASWIFDNLSNAPTPPGGYAHFINVGTDHLLDIIEERYFKDQLSRSLGAFKYVQAGYGGGKTQFILSLTKRAQQNRIVSCRVDVGAECPFNSKLAIFKAVMASFLPLSEDDLLIDSDERGIEVLIQRWIKRQVMQHGVGSGEAVPDAVRAEIGRAFAQPMLGSPDYQMATGLRQLSTRLLEHACGADPTNDDDNLIAWVRGDKVSSSNLKRQGMAEAAKDDNAFNRMNTAFRFLRTRMGYQGFFVAFDEGGRANSFRRGSVKQKQMVENLLDFINKTGDQQFPGVVFLYAANDEFRSDVIANYEALENRIGGAAMSAGSPMVPFIDLDAANTPELLDKLGKKLMDVFDAAQPTKLDRSIQSANIKRLVAAYELTSLRLSPRTFVALMTRFLPRQAKNQRLISDTEAEAFVMNIDAELDAADEVA